MNQNTINADIPLLDLALVLRDQGNGSLAKSMCITHFMQKLLTPEFYAAMELDLNPHLHIKAVCAEIAGNIEFYDLECSKEDVMMQWLTIYVVGSANMMSKSESPQASAKEQIV